MNDFVKVAGFIPEAARKKVEEAKAFLVANPGAVFRGPLLDSSGKELLAKDVVADDKWKSEVAFYVKGVEGKVPSGK
jgi:basic membrane protein A and related proteins